MKIHKHVFSIVNPYVGQMHSLDMPQGSKIIAAQLQYDDPTIWYTVPNIEGFAGKYTRRFQFFVTGFEEVPNDAVYINTFQFDEGRFVLHMFEVK